MLTLDGVHVYPVVKETSLQRRLYGREIQCLIHTFGEVRYCTRDVLELVEDAARDTVLRVLYRLIADGDVNISNITTALRADSRASYRMLQTLKSCSEPADYNRIAERVPIFRRPWEDLAELGSLFPSSSMKDRTHATADPHYTCAWHALNLFRSSMGDADFAEFQKCRDVVFVDGHRSTPKHRFQSTPARFCEWLGLDPKTMGLSNEALIGLGHISWEVVGVITQRALLVRYFEDFAAGDCDPRANEWTYSRHLLAALNHGLGSGILVALTDLQAKSLLQDISSFYTNNAGHFDTWRPHAYASSPHLLPHHVYEALRRLERERHMLLSSI